MCVDYSKTCINVSKADHGYELCFRNSDSELRLIVYSGADRASSIEPLERQVIVSA